MDPLLLLLYALLLSIITLITKNKHFLITLLALEAITLILIILISSISIQTNMINILLRILVLTLGACEASIGLRLLVNISRKTGSDMLKSLSINSC